jgi:hypothetical protein
MVQGTEVPPYLEVYITPPSAVAAGRAAVGDIFLPAEGNAPVTTMSRGNFDEGLIGKFFHVII